MYKILAIILLLLSAKFIYAAEFYVAVDGNDSNTGTKESPLASLDGAKNAVRRLLKNSHQEQITVYFTSGTYKLEKTVIFTPEDSPAKGKIIYTAIPGEKEVFSSGIQVTGWKKVDRSDEPDGLATEAQGKLFAAKIPPQLGCIKTLYLGNEKLLPAQSAGFFPTEIEPRLNNNKRFEKSDYNIMCFPEGKIHNWDNLKDIEVRIIPRYQFSMNILPLLSVDEKNLTATTKIDGTYQLIKGYFSDSKQLASVWVENSSDGLNIPGKWMVNTKKGKIYYWPKSDTDLKRIVAPVLKELIRFEGNEIKKDYTKNIVLRGFIFTHGERDTWDEKTACIQHDYAAYDRADALIRFRFAEDCKIEYCHFTNSGGGGIRCDLYAQNISIENNKFDNLGSFAVLLAGYGPGTVDENKNNRVVNNHIHDIGQEYWQSSAILIYQSGNNIIANNYIHDVPFNGIALVGHRSPYFKRGKRSREIGCIRFDEIGKVRQWPQIIRFLHGNNNIVEYNRITRIAKRLGDVNAIYISSTGINNHIRFNYLYDLQRRTPNAAIRSDDEQHDTYINHNVIKGSVGRGITLKGRNYCNNNFIIDIAEHDYPCNPNKIPLHGYILLKRGPMEGSTIQKNILYHLGKNPIFFWTGPAFGTVTKLSDADTDNNLIYCAGNIAKAKEHLTQARSKYGVEQNSIASDPLFKDIKNHDYTFKPGSPAFTLGIEPIDIKNTGLLSDVGPENMH